MSYESAPATQFVATHCCACGRALVEADSVELGIGPICRKKYGYGAISNPLAASEANALVYELSARQHESWAAVAPLIARLRELGYAVLADRCQERLAPQPEIFITTCQDRGRDYYKVVSPYNEKATADWRTIRGRFFRKDKDAAGKETPYNFVPTTERKALWTLLNAHYAGKIGQGPSGVFEVAVKPAKAETPRAARPVTPAGPPLGGFLAASTTWPGCLVERPKAPRTERDEELAADLEYQREEIARDQEAEEAKLRYEAQNARVVPLRRR